MPPLSMIDSTYKVSMEARPSNYNVTHISWARPTDNLNWYRYVLVRSPYGYPQNPDDGTLVYPDVSNIYLHANSKTTTAFTDDLVFRVNAVSTGGVVSGLDVLELGTTSWNSYLISVSPVSTDALKGKNLVISLDSSATVTIVNGGGDYAVGDIVRVPGNSLVDPTSTSTATLSGVTSNTQLGVTNTFHIYDTGSSTATTANPGIVAGSNPYDKQFNKYYYSLFAYVGPANTSSPKYIYNMIPVNGDVNYSDFTWIKLGETSSVVVPTTSTLDVLIEHLPAFYSGKNSSNENTDLSNFLSLFAFHLDVYLTETKAVFTMADSTTIDETLLKLFLKQYGSELKRVSDLKQARKVLENIIRDYSLGGTTLGLKNLIESYTGNAVSQITGLNILPDYNTSSFVEGIGNWYPVPSVTNSYDASFPYNYTLDPMVAALDYANSNTSEAKVAQILDASIVSAVNISPNVSFLGKLGYTGASGGTITNNYETVVTASATSSGTTITVDDTSKLKLGSVPLVVSGTGVFSAQTVITYIDKDGKTFKVNIAPSTALTSGAKVAISNSITSGSLSLSPANTTTTGTITFYNGIRQGTTATSTTITTGSTQYLSPIKPNIVKVGDYVSGHSSIPSGTKVTAIGTTSTTAVKLSNKVTATVPSGTTLYFSSQPSTELGAAVDMLPVASSTPYAFGAHFNANGGTTKNTIVGLTWYDGTGNILSTVSSTLTAPTATVPLANTDFAKTWYPNYITANSPSTAAYVSPYFSVVSAADTVRYCVDSVFLNRPINITGVSRSSNTAYLDTDTPHNFYYDPSGVWGKVSVTIPGNSSFNTTEATITGVTQLANGTYSFSYANSGPDVNKTTVAGYAASMPMALLTVGGKSTYLTQFQDARDTSLEVVADRINRVANPNFEYDTVGSTSPYGWNDFYGGGTVLTVASISSYPVYIGTKSLYVNKPAGTTASATARCTSVNVTPGKTYTASVYVRYSGVTATNQIKVGIAWGDGINPPSSPVYGTSVGISASAKQWSRATLTATAPAGKTVAYVEVASNSSSSSQIQYTIDCAMLEEAVEPLHYFDGDYDGFNYISTRDSMWESTPGQSRSHLYKNRTLNQDNIDTLVVRGINYA